MTATLNCPNCGYGFEALARSTRMFDCPACGTTLFRAEDALNPMGDHGEMHDVPMLLRIGDDVEIGGRDYHVIGHVRFDYGRGTWDEMWAVDGAGGGVWVSLDEGDVVAQWLLPPGEAPRQSQLPRLGMILEHDGMRYDVTEADSASAVALRGELPEAIALGERHAFANATGPGAMLLSGEFWTENGEPASAWYAGRWLDPFTLRIDRA